MKVLKTNPKKKKNLKCEFNNKNFQGTSPTCLVYHLSGQTIY